MVDLVGSSRVVNDREAGILGSIRITVWTLGVGDLELIATKDRREFFPGAVGDLAFCAMPILLARGRKPGPSLEIRAFAGVGRLWAEQV